MRKKVTLIPADSHIHLNIKQVARLYGKRWTWAKDLLQGWLEEQEKRDAPIRVFRKGNRLYTTRATLRFYMPMVGEVSDTEKKIVRKIYEIERELDHLAERINKIISTMPREKQAIVNT